MSETKHTQLPMEQSTVDLAMMTTISNHQEKNAKLEEINRELLAALEECKKALSLTCMIDKTTTSRNACDIANKAIAKAKGETNA